ncbi:MAG TPA: hypothetical protein VGP07_27110 [Polyangia bacterium]
MAASLLGCGSGGAPGGLRGGAGGTTATGSGSMTWKDDGAAHGASFATGVLARTSVTDLLEVSGADTAGMAIAFALSTPTPIAAAPFTCAQVGTNGIIVSLVYTTTGNATNSTQSCAINLATVGTTTGAHAIGTFSAVIALTAGGTKTLSDGQFDLPLTVSQTGL